MPTSKLSLLERIPSEHDSAFVKHVRSWMESSDTTLVYNEAVRTTASESVRLWRVRVENTGITGLKLEGAASLLARLSGLAQRSLVEQFGLTGNTITGTLFFSVSGHEFLGAVLVPTKAKLSNPASQLAS